jgi:hypothetical protein
MRFQDIVDQLPPKQDMIRFARYLSSLRRPSRAEVLIYGVSGVLIGAGLALLFAPARGSELRGAIGERLEEYWGNGWDAVRGANGGAQQDR